MQAPLLDGLVAPSAAWEVKCPLAIKKQLDFSEACLSFLRFRQIILKSDQTFNYALAIEEVLIQLP